MIIAVDVFDLTETMSPYYSRMWTPNMLYCFLVMYILLIHESICETTKYFQWANPTVEGDVDGSWFVLFGLPQLPNQNITNLNLYQ